MSDKDGGTAFPHDGIQTLSGDFPGALGDPIPASPGMSLRDYFAAAALQGMVAGSQGLAITRKEFARDSFALADAMLEARK